ncbi:MAG: hypothetical protein Ta2A_26720 [Treponemataceae bacterium]|nr:MAG: hypothetical protein Ta2A_26720 [Treponemataceae bacterium]
MTTNETRAKVFAIGNKLAVAMPREDAFIKAWAIVKAQSLVLRVAGVSFGSRQYALGRLAQYPQAAVRAFLVPESDTPTTATRLRLWLECRTAAATTNWDIFLQAKRK